MERTVDVRPDLVWLAWTSPEHLKQWFTPAPWQTVHCEIDLRPGGAFRTVMRSPEGEESDESGCYLEVVEGRRLVWTTVLLPGYRPAPPTEGGLPLTAIIELAPAGTGTRYRATAIHGVAADRDRHAAMGFEEGWGKALDQLVALMAAG